MPQTPDDLSRIIKEMAQKHAKTRGAGISSDALDRIGKIPTPYDQRGTIDVDLGKLDSMIGDIIEIARKLSGRTINLPEIEKAHSEVKCHYLWFC